MAYGKDFERLEEKNTNVKKAVSFWFYLATFRWYLIKIKWLAQEHEECFESWNLKMEIMYGSFF